MPDARVSCPLEWDEVAGVDPAGHTMLTVPERFRAKGDPGASVDAHAGRLDSLFELAARQEREGLGEAPYPPHFPTARGEPARVQPSKARKGRAARDGGRT